MIFYVYFDVVYQASKNVCSSKIRYKNSTESFCCFLYCRAKLRRFDTVNIVGTDGGKGLSTSRKLRCWHFLKSTPYNLKRHWNFNYFQKCSEVRLYSFSHNHGQMAGPFEHDWLVPRQLHVMNPWEVEAGWGKRGQTSLEMWWKKP